MSHAPSIAAYSFSCAAQPTLGRGLAAMDSGALADRRRGDIDAFRPRGTRRPSGSAAQRDQRSRLSRSGWPSTRRRLGMGDGPADSTRGVTPLQRRSARTDGSSQGSGRQQGRRARGLSMRSSRRLGRRRRTAVGPALLSGRVLPSDPEHAGHLVGAAPRQGHAAAAVAVVVNAARRAERLFVQAHCSTRRAEADPVLEDPGIL